MPKSVEKCVASLKADPNFKPKNKNDTKEEAAWAVCQAAHKKGKLSEDGIPPVQFVEDFLTVDEALSKDEAYKVYDSTRWALDNSIFDIMANPDITGKKEKVLAQVESFANILKEKFKDLNFSGPGAFVLFSGGVLDYEVIPQGDGMVNIKNLAIVQLGYLEDRDLDLNLNWAQRAKSKFYNQKNTTGFIPPVFISHKIPDGTVGKPVTGFIEELNVIGNVLYADLTGVPEGTAKSFPYRSVELNKDDLSISGLALLGSDEIPYFKFEPVIFGDKKEGKIVLTFKDEGGENMGQVELTAEAKKSLKDEIIEGVKAFFGKSKENDSPPDKRVFTEEEVTKEKERVKLETEKASQVKFAEERKKEEQAGLMKLFFAGKDQKEGVFLAPALRPKVEVLFSKLDNLETIKFSETGQDGKPAEKENTQFGLLKEVFSEIMQKPESFVVLGERTRYTMQPTPQSLTGEQFSEEEVDKTGKHVVGKYGTQRKKEKKE